MSDKKKNSLSFTSNRRFGIELEINAFDGRSRPLENKRPEGIEYVAQLVEKQVPEVGVEIRGYEHSSQNKWIVKPDSSCGMEIVSPPSKGWAGSIGLRAAVKVVEALSKDDKIRVDKRCSVHVHVDVTDLSEEQIASIVSWYIKCEPVFLDAMPQDRKRNKYCQFIGLNSIFSCDRNYSSKDILAKCGDVKYYSMNTYNYVNGNRKTIEFRPIEGSGVKDPYLVKNWVRLLLHFVEMTADLGRPKPYIEPKNDTMRKNVTPWTSLAWLDPEHVLSLLGFSDLPSVIPNHRNETEYSLSNGLTQTRDWLLARLQANMSRHQAGGLRYHAAKQLDEILERFKSKGLIILAEKHLSPKEQQEEILYGDNYQY